MGKQIWGGTAVEGRGTGCPGCTNDDLWSQACHVAPLNMA